MKRVLFAAIVVALLAAGCVPVAGGGPTAGPAADPTVAPMPADAAVVDHPQLTSIQMLNEMDGWGLTDSAVLRTNDGGTTWHNVSPPGGQSLGYSASGDYLDSNRAFIEVPDPSDPMHAGILHKTEDGGKTWGAQMTPFGTSRLYFLDSSSGWAMAGLGVAAGSNAIAIFQTTDGGETWVQKFINDPTVQSSSDEIPLGGLKGAFAALDMQTAWVGGVIYSPATVYLYRTDDGGSHWSHVALDVPPGSEDAQLSIDAIQFVNANDGFVSMQVSGATNGRAVYATHDAGKSWTLLPSFIPDGRTADFVSADDGFIFDASRFQVTHDAGKTWQAVEPDIVFSESFMHMDFVNAMTGWVLASNPTTFEISVYKTTDGGRTWVPQ